MTPTDHTSTLLEIFGGSFPTTKHSGGKDLVWGGERGGDRQKERIVTIYNLNL